MKPTTKPLEAEHITLYYREGSSDKMYQCSIEPAGAQFVVNFAFGRRGSTLNTGTKTTAPVDYETAKRIFDKLVREKTAKGYTPGADGTPYRHTDKEQRVTGLLPQLLNPIDESEVARLVADERYAMQEKFDGKRMLLVKAGDAVSGVNRKGLTVGLPSSITESAKGIPGDFILDGECVGDVLFAFDLLELNGEDQRQSPYRKRMSGLTQLLGSGQHSHIQLAKAACSSNEKRHLLERLRAENKEGVVFKQLDAPYSPGRPNSGGPQLKHKFYATLSAVVGKVNAQRSVEVRLRDGRRWVVAGNVTIPVNQSVPLVGAVVEIRYLYAFKESRCLYQPTYLGERSDVTESECLVAQLKYKSGGDEEES
jgi:bifunctional non-homologous end joining protein LigD